MPGFRGRDNGHKGLMPVITSIFLLRVIAQGHKGLVPVVSDAPERLHQRILLLIKSERKDYCTLNALDHGSEREPTTLSYGRPHYRRPAANTPTNWPC